MILAEMESSEQFLSGGGEMGKLIRSMDWSKTALGPVESWPQSLRTSVSLCLSSTFPILIAWGPETIQIYNDSYRPICGAKHPESMGQNFRICWETALPVVGDKFTRGQQGEGTYITDQRMFLDRYGYLEEAWMTFSFAPIRDESGGVGGIFHPITESTEKMLSARRTQTLRDLGAAIGKAKTVQEIGDVTQLQYNYHQFDVPFLLFYQAHGDKVKLIKSAGIEAGSALSPGVLAIDNSIWPLKQVLESGEVVEFKDLQSRFGDFNCPPYDEAPHTAMVLPIFITGQSEIFGFLVAGVSACRALDQAYFNFYEQLASTFNAAVSNVYAYEQEQKRAEALAEIDRSKTAFFSNVSHEFRTPLTLMLGPLEDLLQQGDLPKHHTEHIEATHRNAMRLLKLVNNLLDYSRVEAGRVQAAYQPIDLTELTMDLASSFRSIIEKAGMQLVVQCKPLEGQFYADRQMWEKIVLNLLSNAFKYTLKGSITVELYQDDGCAYLRVIDTGIGIPTAELPHMFERFHRVENAGGRTHEGTGIGLSLVNELVTLHGGEISVSSVEGAGSTFTVKIPEGKAHLPAYNIVEPGREANTDSVALPFIREAYGLLQNDTTAVEDIEQPVNVAIGEHYSPGKKTRVLIVDDNADMRNYLKRLLDPYFTVHTAKNGAEALLQIHEHTPALVLSDIMMPVMDGKALLNHIRNNEETYRLPVIFLSARAGEEARIDGLEAGADDYMVKPFSAAELLTKVRAQININQARNHAEEQLRQLLMQAPVAMAIYRGPNHIVEIANDRMLAYWGKNDEEISRRPVFEVMPELDKQGFRQIMNTVYQTGERFTSSEIPVKLNRYGSNDLIYINLTVEALRDENQHVNGMIAVAADVTEQVNARHELEKVSDTLTLAMDATGMGIWKINWESGEAEISAHARKIYGMSLISMYSFTHLLEFIASEHRDRFKQTVQYAVDTKGSFDEDYQIIPLGETKPKWVNSAGKIELDEDGKVLAVIGTVLDITESKEDDIRKNDFIGMVSHELKTPLTSLSGYAQIGLKQSQKNADQFNSAMYQKVANQVHKMTGLINGFLNVSRFDSGKINLNITTFRIDELIRDMVVEADILSIGHPFELAIAEASVTADRDKIGTVITNLISNAIKYAKDNPVEVSCVATADGVTVSVRDRGIGIDAVDLEKLFERYYRVENTHTQNISGFGIGLYLSGEIIKRHGGRIWAESELGKGSTFSFTLPVKLPEQTIAA